MHSELDDLDEIKVIIQKWLYNMSEDELFEFSEKVLPPWEQMKLPWIYTNPDKFRALLAKCKNEISHAGDNDGDVIELAKSYIYLSKDIDETIPILARFFSKKYGQNGMRKHMEAIGFKVGKNGDFIIGKEINERKNMIFGMFAMISKAEFSNLESDIDTWLNHYYEMKDIVVYDNLSDRNVKLMEKALENRKEIETVLRSLAILVGANHPDTYKSILREWGYQFSL